MGYPGQIQAKREAARRARAIALSLAKDEDRAVLRRFADELEEEAERLDRAMAAMAEPPLSQALIPTGEKPLKLPSL